MLEVREVAGASENSASAATATATAMAMALRASVHSPAGCLCSQRSSKGASPSGSHLDGFEPQADVVLRPSALHLAERIFKRLVKLRKRALSSRYASCFPLDPCRGAVTEAEGRTHSLDSASLEAERGCGYDSDEQSAGFVSVDTPTSSSSSSFESLPTSHGAPPAPGVFHKPGSQIMANMLLSLLNGDAFALEEADDEADSGNESEEYNFGGPRESAWHQPEDEILTEQEWRMMRYGHLQGSSKPAIAAIAAPKQHASAAAGHAPSFKFLFASSSKHPSNIVLHHSPSTGSKRETKHI